MFFFTSLTQQACRKRDKQLEESRNKAKESVENMREQVERLSSDYEAQTKIIETENAEVKNGIHLFIF